MNTTHPRVWGSITIGGVVDVGQMAKLMDTQGRAYVRQGRWLLLYITENADAIDAQFDAAITPIAPPTPIVPSITAPIVQSITTPIVQPSEYPEVIQQLPEPYTCNNSPIDESVERLTTIVDVCFKTGNGRVWLENDLALWDPTDPAGWLEKMRLEWSNRIHSGWLDEFMNALELWIVAH